MILDALLNFFALQFLLLVEEDNNRRTYLVCKDWSKRYMQTALNSDWHIVSTPKVWTVIIIITQDYPYYYPVKRRAWILAQICWPPNGILSSVNQRAHLELVYVVSKPCLATQIICLYSDSPRSHMRWQCRDLSHLLALVEQHLFPKGKDHFFLLCIYEAWTSGSLGNGNFPLREPRS